MISFFTPLIISIYQLRDYYDNFSSKARIAMRDIYEPWRPVKHYRRGRLR